MRSPATTISPNTSVLYQRSIVWFFPKRKVVSKLASFMIAGVTIGGLRTPMRSV